LFRRVAVDWLWRVETTRVSANFFDFFAASFNTSLLHTMPLPSVQEPYKSLDLFEGKHHVVSAQIYVGLPRVARVHVLRKEHGHGTFMFFVSVPAELGNHVLEPVFKVRVAARKVLHQNSTNSRWCAPRTTCELEGVFLGLAEAVFIGVSRPCKSENILAIQSNLETFAI